MFETTECDKSASCSACSVSVNGKQCTSCTPTECVTIDNSTYPSFDIDCVNVDPSASYSLCNTPTIESGPLQVLSTNAFASCVRDPMESCSSVKAYEEDLRYDSCECTTGTGDAEVTLTCSDSTRCPRSCSLDLTVCWADSTATTFDANGQPSLSSEIRTYIEGRDEVVTWKGRYADTETCRMTVNGLPCNSCGYTTCSDDNIQAPAVDCENIEVGASIDTCLTDWSVEGQTGVLQAFNDVGTNKCLKLSDPQALCQDEVEFYVMVGSTCECAIDPVTGTDYILTCELSSCLSCNTENTVCAHRGSSVAINKYGRQHSSVITYTYVSGGRDETVIVSGLDGFDAEACSISINGTLCTSCEPTTCRIGAFEFEGTVVDCENIETGATYNTCGSDWVVDTGVLEVLSSTEFYGSCYSPGES
jgi:hypothetical protein